jgi:hypothetical protein
LPFKEKTVITPAGKSWDGILTLNVKKTVFTLAWRWPHVPHVLHVTSSAVTMHVEELPISDFFPVCSLHYVGEPYTGVEFARGICGVSVVRRCGVYYWGSADGH